MSNFKSTIKITNNYQGDPPVNGSGASPGAQQNSTRIYLTPNENPKFESPVGSNGYGSHNSRESPEKNGGVRYHSGTLPRKNGDFKEDYDPEYRKNENIYWRDPANEAKLKKDYYINHQKMTEEEYNQYLDKENIRGKSLLNRISAEDDIRDKAREYYEKNKTPRKVSRTVSEIFSKKPSPQIKKEDSPTNESKSTLSTSTVPRRSESFTPKDINTTSFLSGNNYAPVYKTRRSSSFLRKSTTIEEGSPNETPKKTETSFSDAYKRPSTTSKFEYSVPSYRSALSNNNEVPRVKSLLDSSPSREASMSPQREIKPFFISNPVVNFGSTSKVKTATPENTAPKSTVTTNVKNNTFSLSKPSPYKYDNEFKDCNDDKYTPKYKVDIPKYTTFSENEYRPPFSPSKQKSGYDFIDNDKSTDVYYSAKDHIDPKLKINTDYDDNRENPDEVFYSPKIVTKFDHSLKSPNKYSLSDGARGKNDDKFAYPANSYKSTTMPRLSYNSGLKDTNGGSNEPYRRESKVSFSNETKPFNTTFNEKHKQESIGGYRDAPAKESKVTFSNNTFYEPTLKVDTNIARAQKILPNGGQLESPDIANYADEEKDARHAELMKMYHEEHQRSADDDNIRTPARIKWVPNKRGVSIKDIVDGQPCDNCPESCSGFSPHSWRKTCQSCKCPRESHTIYQEEYADVRARLGVINPSHWAPPGLPPVKAEAFLRASGAGNSLDRSRRLVKQLPRQDLAAAHCRHLDSKDKASYEDFIAARNEVALDIGYAKENHGGPVECPTCHLAVKTGELGVVAIRLGDEVMFHPACFVCVTCEELLADLAYCELEGRPYCERHYAEMLKPRCSACDELIFSGEYTKAMNKDWHSGHFCCWQCDESLTGQRYVLRDEHPYCIKCYESVFANGCEECNKIIGIDSKDLSYKDKHWHEACFLCAKCRVSLVDKQFGSKVDKIYCGNCYDAQFASRCDGCGEVFRAGTKKMEYKTRQWHEKCFCCVVCKTPIGTKSFIPREQEIYCAGCYEEKFATRCVKCNKIITQGGVTYKNEPWHRECFTCTHCSTSLAGQRFTSRDDKPYCAECFGELFAKRCTSCSKPITGIGGTRFISFEDRHWHNDCFICALCKTSLVGRGFITDGPDIICPECAKQKLL